MKDGTRGRTELVYIHKVVINEMRRDQHSALSECESFYVARIDSSDSHPVLRLVVQRWEFRGGFCLYWRDNGEIPS